jgi:hypothetical protein
MMCALTSSLRAPATSAHPQPPHFFKILILTTVTPSARRVGTSPQAGQVGAASGLSVHVSVTSRTHYCGQLISGRHGPSRGRVVGRGELDVRVRRHSCSAPKQVGHGVVAHASQAPLERAAKYTDTAELPCITAGCMHILPRSVGGANWRAQILANLLRCFFFLGHQGT